MPDDGKDALRRHASAQSATGSLREHASGIVAFATVLGLLHFGRDVLIPLTLALMLSLLIAPLVRALWRIGLGQTSSVIIAVLACALAFTTSAAVLGTQVVRMAASLPQYERTIRHKLRVFDELTVGRLDALTSEAGRLLDVHNSSSRLTSRERAADHPAPAPAPSPSPVDSRNAGPLQVTARILASVWPPVEATGIVLVVLVFVLLEREVLRDRFIRMAGATNIRLTTLALDDAGERLSRYFLSQFAVNLGVGAAIALGLAALGLPHAALWGALATLLRFVPYLGIWLAALLSSVLALAIVPGWSLALGTAALFVAVELLAANAVEPHLYGHSTGLSPLSIIIAAIFWSALWGPIGLILSTPLTLCLLVAGRHMKSLNFLELLLADTPALTLPQKFYQRALAGDATEIIAAARAFLRRNSFAAYCDLVLMPALHLGFIDYEMGAISQERQAKMRSLLVAVVAALSGEKLPRSRAQPRSSVLDDANPGRVLRQHREHALGRWQGPVAVPPGTVMLCLGAGGTADVIGAELLVRALREQKLDARHVTLEDLEAGPRPPGAAPARIGVVFLVSAFPSPERGLGDPLLERLRKLLPGVQVAPVFLPGLGGRLDLAPAAGASADQTLNSFVEAVQICLEKPGQDPQPTAIAELLRRRRVSGR